MQLLAAKFNQIATAIETTNAQIAALQAKLSELQEHQQQLQSVEQACQSALSQVDTALMMLHHVDPSQVDTFKDALVVKFATDAIGILEPADTAPTQPIEPEPTAPTAPSAPVAPDTDPVIDVEVTTDTPAADEPIKPAVKTAVDIETLLNKMSLADIRKLAKAKGSDARGNRVNIAARLKKIVTESDIWDATA
jgi:FtsZ-binding cell division protein ZapB